MVTVWVPAFPPIPATIGMAAARATIWLMVSEKRLITDEARKAVKRLITNQGRRRLTDSKTGLSSVSPESTPPIKYISSVYSSLMTWMISSLVIIPKIRFLLLTTGTTDRLYLVTIRETSSWSVVGVTEMTLGLRISLSFCWSDLVKISRISTVPLSKVLASTTKRVSITSFSGAILRMVSKAS